MNSMMYVQFCPCGHVYMMSVDEIKEKIGDRQLDQIQSGEKLDAPILPSSLCHQCQAERSLEDWMALDD